MDRESGPVQDVIPAGATDNPFPSFRPLWIERQSRELIIWFDRKTTSRESLEPAAAWLNGQLAGQFPQAQAIVGGHAEPGIRLSCGQAVWHNSPIVGTVFEIVRPRFTRDGRAVINIIRRPSDRVHIGTIIELATSANGGRYDNEDVARLTSDERTKHLVHKAERHFGHHGPGNCIRFSVEDPLLTDKTLEQACEVLGFYPQTISTEEPDKDAALLPYCEYRNPAREPHI